MEIEEPSHTGDTIGDFVRRNANKQAVIGLYALVLPRESDYSGKDYHRIEAKEGK